MGMPEYGAQKVKYTAAAVVFIQLSHSVFQLIVWKGKAPTPKMDTFTVLQSIITNSSKIVDNQNWMHKCFIYILLLFEYILWKIEGLFNFIYRILNELYCYQTESRCRRLNLAGIWVHGEGKKFLLNFSLLVYVLIMKGKNIEQWSIS